MYSVTKRIEFCYGHRLLDYDGMCAHPHGHNAVAEVEIRSGELEASKTAPSRLLSTAWNERRSCSPLDPPGSCSGVPAVVGDSARRARRYGCAAGTSPNASRHAASPTRSIGLHTR